MRPDPVSFPRPSWRIRRRIIVASLVYCAIAVGWIIAKGGDADIAQALIYAALGIIGTYVFGAAWDDRNLLSLRRWRERVPEPDPEDGEPSP